MTPLCLFIALCCSRINEYSLPMHVNDQRNGLHRWTPRRACGPFWCSSSLRRDTGSLEISSGGNPHQGGSASVDNMEKQLANAFPGPWPLGCIEGCGPLFLFWHIGDGTEEPLCLWTTSLIQGCDPWVTGDGREPSSRPWLAEGSQNLSTGLPNPVLLLKRKTEHWAHKLKLQPHSNKDTRLLHF